ncbi:UNVERIFIED_CONTAM: hypothetical protein FKN15_052482 [Acipenser sinensis]
MSLREIAAHREVARVSWYLGLRHVGWKAVVKLQRCSAFFWLAEDSLQLGDEGTAMHQTRRERGREEERERELLHRCPSCCCLNKSLNEQHTTSNTPAAAKERERDSSLLNFLQVYSMYVFAPGGTD